MKFRSVGLMHTSWSRALRKGKLRYFDFLKMINVTGHQSYLRLRWRKKSNKKINFPPSNPDRSHSKKDQRRWGRLAASQDALSVQINTFPWRHISAILSYRLHFQRWDLAKCPFSPSCSFLKFCLLFQLHFLSCSLHFLSFFFLAEDLYPHPSLAYFLMFHPLSTSITRKERLSTSPLTIS